MMQVRLAAAWVALWACAAAVNAQSLPPLTDAPDTQPALGAVSAAVTPEAPPAPPYTAIVPQGMQKITAGDYTAFAPADYVAQTRAGLAKVTPATRPTTMPSDILQRLADNRANLLSQMSADLLIPQAKAAAFVDGPLKDDLTKLADLHAHLFVVVATQEQVTAAAKQGWTAPLFHFNILANRTYFEPRVVVSTEHKMDDVVLWTEVTPGETDEKIASTLAATIHEFETGFDSGASQDAMHQARMKLVDFIGDNAIKPLKLPQTEQWLGMGLSSAMSSKYLAEITGISRAALAASAASDSPANPLQSAPMDLLHEFDASSIKPRFMPYYLDAISRKAAGVVQKMIDKGGGDAVVPKLLTSLQASVPPDNASLVSLIQQITGVDLTNNLLPPQN